MNFKKITILLLLILSINNTIYPAAISDMDLTEDTNLGLTALMLATSEGNFELVKKIISDADYKKKLKKHKKTLNGQDIHGRSALHWAIIEDKLEIADYLLNFPHLDSNCPDIDGFTPLMLAITTDKRIFFDLLLSKKVDVTHKDKLNQSAIHKAIIRKNREMVEILAQRYNHFEDIIAFANQRNRLDLLPILEDSQRSTEFYTTLKQIMNDDYPLYEKEIKIFKLLEDGINVNHSLIALCWEELCRIDWKKQVINKIIITLIQKGIDVNQEIDYKGKALHYACLFQNHEVVKSLIDHKALLNEINGSKETPLHKTVPLRLKYTFTVPFNFNIALNLIQAGAHVNEKDSNGKTFLNRYFSDQQKEFRSNPIEVLQLLIKYNADLNSQDNRGNTPLHHLVHEAPEIEHVKILLDAKANPNIKNTENKTAFDIFISLRTLDLEKYKAILKLFFDYGAQ